MMSLFMIRVNMTDGLLPAGLQSTDFPQMMNDIEMCVTNLREIPDDLDTKWPLGAIIQVEYSQLTSLSLALTRLRPFFMFLTGNPITEIPPEVFEVDGMMYLGISEMNIHELPQSVMVLSPSLNVVELDNTNISFYWSWMDELVGRVDNPALIVAGASPYCDDLKRIESGVQGVFSIPLSPEYSSILMNPSEDNRDALKRAVDCNFVDDGPYYPLALEDSRNALYALPSEIGS
ncbi:unnamed protein product [Phytophthora lilii]|uniref:Unnamed protein product n=1 Tax=Phytophthora lilii TaxID=2077276 RepID=A0A9W6WZC2_9STRA|nr:unnamed protein product [Phytophthora lilii]